MSELQEAKEALRSSEALSEITKKANAPLPEGFEISWWHRHDPFDSMWALYRHGVRIATSEMGSDDFDKAALYDHAWKRYREACDVFPKEVKEN
jgi:hypothetical protein